MKLHEAQEAALKEALREAERAMARAERAGNSVDMEYMKNTVIKVGATYGFIAVCINACLASA